MKPNEKSTAETTTPSFLLFMSQGVVQAMGTVQMPGRFQFRGLDYWRSSSSLGEYSALRNKRSQLVGFSFSVFPSDKLLNLSIVKGARNVELQNNVLNFYLGEERNCQEDPVLGASCLYRSGEEFIIGIYEWGAWGELGFRLYEPFSDEFCA